jgi:hypothetical protein
MPTAVIDDIATHRTRLRLRAISKNAYPAQNEASVVPLLRDFLARAERDDAILSRRYCQARLSTTFS